MDSISFIKQFDSRFITIEEVQRLITEGYTSDDIKPLNKEGKKIVQEFISKFTYLNDPTPFKLEVYGNRNLHSVFHNTMFQYIYYSNINPNNHTGKHYILVNKSRIL